MKLKYITMAAVAAASMAATSCSDSFLDEKIFSTYSPTVSDPQSELIGLYRWFAGYYGNSGYQGFHALFQVGTDVAVASAPQGIEIPFYQYGQLTKDATGPAFIWEKLYECITNTNLIISKQEALGDKADKAVIGEAKFFRAYCYDQLVTYYGDTKKDLGVPLITEANTDNPRTDYTRNKITDIDKVIDEDLTYAIENLPNVDEAAEQSRANKDMARQLAGQVYLRIGMRDASYYAKAEKVLTDIISSGKYSLVENRYGVFVKEPGDYYADMFRSGNLRRSQGNTETIWTFEMEYSRDVNGGTIDSPQQRRVWGAAIHNLPGFVNADSLGGRGIYRLRSSNFIKYGLYAKGDIRNSNYILRRTLWLNKPDYTGHFALDKDGFRVDAGSADAVAGTEFTMKTGDKYVVAKDDSLNRFSPYTLKWGQYDPTNDFGYGMVKDWPLMRLGETYLLRAEARLRQGNYAGAAEDINVLRDRAFQDYRAAGHPGAGAVTAAEVQSGGIDFILDERARELFGEENRRYTLMRTQTLAERIKNYADNYPEANKYGNGKNCPSDKMISGFNENKAIFPIPQTEIDLNKDATLEQNPGY